MWGSSEYHFATKALREGRNTRPFMWVIGVCCLFTAVLGVFGQFHPDGPQGVKAASVVMEFAEKYGIPMPIAREVDGVINHGSTVEQAYRGLVAEKPGHEVHGSGF